MKRKVVCIVGPTASGKSTLALEFAQKYDGEIICADSQTIRKGLNIGTAKPTLQDQRKVHHHMLDIIGPYDQYSAAEFKRTAEEVIADIQSRGKLPVIVGGTGLYIDALLYNFTFKEKPNNELREELNRKNVAELQMIIAQKGLHLPNNSQNPRHLIRIIESDGKMPKKHPMRKDVLLVGLDPGREVLSGNIEKRVETMIENGLIQEVYDVIQEHGKPPAHWDAIGYQQIAGEYVLQKTPPNISEIIENLTIAHRQYAKRQRAWFKRHEEIVWFEQKAEAMNYLKKQLSLT